eukprot:3304182-Rhodomonas_salina.4
MRGQRQAGARHAGAPTLQTTPPARTPTPSFGSRLPVHMIRSHDDGRRLCSDHDITSTPWSCHNTTPSSVMTLGVSFRLRGM